MFWLYLFPLGSHKNITFALVVTSATSIPSSSELSDLDLYFASHLFVLFCPYTRNPFFLWVWHVWSIYKYGYCYFLLLFVIHPYVLTFFFFISVIFNVLSSLLLIVIFRYFIIISTDSRVWQPYLSRHEHALRHYSRIWLILEEFFWMPRGFSKKCVLVWVPLATVYVCRF